MTLLGQDYLHNRKVNNAAANQASSQTANRPTTQTTKVTNALDPPVKQTSLYDRDSYYQTLFDIYAELDKQKAQVDSIRPHKPRQTP